MPSEAESSQSPSPEAIVASPPPAPETLPSRAYAWDFFPDDQPFTYTSENDPALLYAWRMFLAYNQASTQSKITSMRLREWAIVLSLLMTAVAAIISSNAQLFGTVLTTVLQYTLIVLPIIITGVLTFSSEFTATPVWAIYRRAAESIRREIYLYRHQAGDYGVESDKREIPNTQILVAKVDAVYQSTEQYHEYTTFLQHFMADTAVVEIVRKDVMWTSDQGEGGDPGFGPIPGDVYLTDRILPQRDWYVGKIQSDERGLRRNRIYILIITGLGSLAVAISVQLGWVLVITSAMVTTLNALIALRQPTSMTESYALVVRNMDTRIVSWRLLTPEQRQQPTEVARLVYDMETIMQAEEDRWFQHTLQTFAAADSILYQNIAQMTGGKVTEDQVNEIRKGFQSPHLEPQTTDTAAAPNGSSTAQPEAEAEAEEQA
ncbi:MAG: DUF4231 domain-containing protein [Anaerolineaceae bacterium]|nr:DUF4231 domain-containing protein [Anaerolineaceae bacterium]